MNIIGAGTDLTFIDAAQLDRLFHIFSGVTLNLSNLTLDNGNATSTANGGAVLNLGTMNLTNVNIQNATAARGGGIFNNRRHALGDGQPVLGQLALLQGGAIYNDGTLTVDSSEIGVSGAGNTANNHGGGVYSTGTVTITESSFTDNVANSRGGGLFNAAPNGDVTIVRSTFDNNFASSRKAIYNEDVLTITNSTLSGNTSGTNAGVGNVLSGQATISNSTILDNDAFRGGGLGNSVTGSSSIALEEYVDRR